VLASWMPPIQQVQALAAHIRRVAHDYALAQRLSAADEVIVKQHLAKTETEIEKCREEMRLMKMTLMTRP